MSIFCRFLHARPAPVLLGAVAWLLAASAAAEVPLGAALPADYASQVSLSLSGEGPWYRLELPMALHLGAQHADLRDLRVFSAEGQAQPYALTLSGPQQLEDRSEIRPRHFPLYGPADATPDLSGIRVQRSGNQTLIEVAPEGERAGQVLRGWLLDTGQQELSLQQLSLDWGAEDATRVEGFQHFSIEASDDLQHWRAWGDGQIAQLSFAAARIDQREVELPGQPARYLRLLWQSPRQAPPIEGATLVGTRHSSTPAPLVWSAPLAGRRTGAGEYQWTLPLALSAQRVRIALPDNTLAPVTLSGRLQGQKSWWPLTSGLLYRLSEPTGERLQNELILDAQPLQQLQLTVDERGGGLSVEAPWLEVGLPATQVVFLARGTPPYTLAIGNPEARAADLPLETLIPGYVDARLAGLGRAVPDAAVVQAASQQAAVPPGWDWSRIGLWAVLLAGVGLLAGMAWSLLRSPSSKP
ncbi:MAG: DUF3999 domain-containing protein [Pseudomonadota bacterium]